MEVDDEQTASVGCKPKAHLLNDVREIGTPAFHARKKLKTDVRCVLIAENITRIPDKLKFIFHYGVGQEKKLGIPANVKVIDDHAFQDCKGLESLCPNEGLARIGKAAFRGCEGLTQVDVPSTVKDIGDNAFLRCASLERLGLHEGLERIGNAAFARCKGLIQVDVPSTVKDIGDGAF
eukprot:scaffold4647_cov57-Cylindrotheca_fusiformis.AAC.1